MANINNKKKDLTLTFCEHIDTNEDSPKEILCIRKRYRSSRFSPDNEANQQPIFGPSPACHCGKPRSQTAPDKPLGIAFRSPRQQTQPATNIP